MPKYAARLIERHEVAEGTLGLVLERPPDFAFTAGQYVRLALPQPPYPDPGGNRRTFSIASPPQDTSHIRIATRMTGSPMKRSLAEMSLGTTVELLGPSGTFVLHGDGSVPAVLIAGGIGITPFLSMVHDAASRRLPHRITLIYSNRTPEGTAFHEEFVRLAGEHERFTYLPTMTQTEASRQPWTGECRRVDGAFLRDRLGDIAAPLYYVAGPPGLVAGVVQAVVEAGADPTRVHAEEFLGY
jgi:ferredoxin-NADP reductase